MRNCCGLKFLLLVLVMSSATLRVAAQNLPPSIDVQGSAEVKVVPDEVFILFGAETSDPDLKVAKSQNDERVKALLALTKELKIDPRYVQTDFINIEPWEHDLGKPNHPD